MKETCNSIALLLERAKEFRWSRTFKEFSSDTYVNDKFLAREIQKVYAGMSSFNDLVIHNNGIPSVTENNELDTLREKLFAESVETITG